MFTYVLMCSAELLTGKYSEKEENPKELLFSVWGDLSYLICSVVRHRIQTPWVSLMGERLARQISSLWMRSLKLPSWRIWKCDLKTTESTLTLEKLLCRLTPIESLTSTMIRQWRTTGTRNSLSVLRMCLHWPTLLSRTWSGDRRTLALSYQVCVCVCVCVCVYVCVCVH